MTRFLAIIAIAGALGLSTTAFAGGAHVQGGRMGPNFVQRDTADARPYALKGQTPQQTQYKWVIARHNTPRGTQPHYERQPVN